MFSSVVYYTASWGLSTHKDCMAYGYSWLNVSSYPFSTKTCIIFVIIIIVFIVIIIITILIIFIIIIVIIIIAIIIIINCYYHRYYLVITSINMKLDINAAKISG